MKIAKFISILLLSAACGQHKESPIVESYEQPTEMKTLGFYDQPTGEIEGVEGYNAITGWACMPRVNAPIAVHLYVGGVAGVGKMLEIAVTNSNNLPRVSEICETNYGLHRFVIPIPDAWKIDYPNQPIYMYGIYKDTVALLINSGRHVIPPYGVTIEPPVPQIGQGMLQGMLVDENVSALIVPGAGLRVRPRGSSDWTYHKIEPTFGLQLNEGEYELDLTIPGREIYYSNCPSCVDHPEISFQYKGNKPFLVTVVKDSYVDVRLAATLRPINQTAFIQGMLIDERVQALVLPGAGIKIRHVNSVQWIYTAITPTFGIAVTPGAYEVEFDLLPNREITMSTCYSCVDHPLTTFRLTNRVTVNLKPFTYTDVRVRAAQRIVFLP